MALDDISRRVLHYANGTQTEFPFAFTIFAEDQVTVYYASDDVDEIISPAQDYDVEFSETGGTVIFHTAPPAGSRVAIVSNVPYTQEMALTNYGGFNPETLNDNADWQAAQIQQLKEGLDRAVKLRPTDELTPDELLKNIFDAAKLAKKYAESALVMSLSFRIPNGMVCPFYNVRVLKRQPIFWGNTTPDPGWLLCDGGPDGASGTVPDLVGKFVRGSMPDDANETGGKDKIVISYDQLPQHSHDTVAVQSSGLHTHGPGSIELEGKFGADSPNFEPTGCFYNAGSQGYGQKDRGGGMIVGFKASSGWTGVTTASGQHQHTIVMGSAGKSAQVDIRPQFYTMAFFVKVPRANEGPSDWLRPIPDVPADMFAVGDEIVGPYYDPVEKAEYPNYNMLVVDIRDRESDDGETYRCATLQAEHLLPWAMPYCPQAFYTCPNGLAAGTYRVYHFGGYPGAEFYFTLTQAVPAGGSLFHENYTNITHGTYVRVYAPDGIAILERVPCYPIYGAPPAGSILLDIDDENANPEGVRGRAKWSISAVRQYLNSDAPVGGWWRKLDKFCVAPDGLFERAGYLAGLPRNIVSALRPVAVETATDVNSSEVTYDRVWLPQSEEFGFWPQHSYDGRRFPDHQLEYWKDKIGDFHTINPGDTIEELIAHPVDKHLAPDQTPAMGYFTRTVPVHALGSSYRYTARTNLVTITDGGSEDDDVPAAWKRGLRPLMALIANPN